MTNVVGVGAFTVTFTAPPGSTGVPGCGTWPLTRAAGSSDGPCTVPRMRLAWSSCRRASAKDSEPRSGTTASTVKLPDSLQGVSMLSQAGRQTVMVCTPGACGAVRVVERKIPLESAPQVTGHLAGRPMRPRRDRERSSGGWVSRGPLCLVVRYEGPAQSTIRELRRARLERSAARART